MSPGKLLIGLYFDSLNVETADDSVENGVRNERLIKYVKSAMWIVRLQHYECPCRYSRANEYMCIYGYVS